MNKVAKAGIIGGLIYGIYKLFGYINLSKNLTFSFKVSKRITVSKVYLTINAIAHNPTNTEVEVTKPTIQVFIEGNLLTESTPDSTKFTIKKLADTTVGPINVEFATYNPIVLQQALKAGVNIVQNIAQFLLNPNFKLGINLNVRGTTYVDGKLIPFDQNVSI